jgi:hypothetical protein
MLVAQHEFQKAAGEVQDAAWLAAAHHLDLCSRLHPKRPQALHQHRMGGQGLQCDPVTLTDAA